MKPILGISPLARGTRLILLSAPAFGFIAAACGGIASSENATDVGAGGARGTASGGASGTADAGGTGNEGGSNAGGRVCNTTTPTPFNFYPNCDGRAQPMCVEALLQVCYCKGAMTLDGGVVFHAMRHLGACTEAESPGASQRDAAAGGATDGGGAGGASIDAQACSSWAQRCYRDSDCCMGYVCSNPDGSPFDGGDMSVGLCARPSCVPENAPCKEATDCCPDPAWSFSCAPVTSGGGGVCFKHVPH